MLGIDDACCFDIQKTGMSAVDVNVGKMSDVPVENAPGFMLSHEHMQWRCSAPMLHRSSFSAARAISGEGKRKLLLHSRLTWPATLVIQVNHFSILLKPLFSMERKRQAV